jgi:site-specific recombinase XerD
MKGINILLIEYGQYLKGFGLAKDTDRSTLSYIRTFYHYWAIQRGKSLRDVREIDLREYYAWLREQFSATGKPYRDFTCGHRVYSVGQFFRWLYESEYILINPAEGLKLPRSHEKGRRGSFSREEMARFLDSISIGEKFEVIPLGQRDRALFELLYSSGLRLSEAVNLNMSDIGLSERMLMVVNGKGGKDRYVPFSEVALMFLRLYLDGVRKALAVYAPKESGEAVFLGPKGRITKAAVWKVFNRTMEKSGIPKKEEPGGSPRTVHSIRHSCATHLLDAGADIYYVSELLGHEDITTTTVYAHVLSESKRGAYKSAHPRENKFYEEVSEEYLREVEKLYDGLLSTKGK